MNTHTIHGRLVRDPELTPRKNSEGSDRVNFTVAVDRRIGDETDYIDCVAFGRRAEVIDKFFSKGKEIIVAGEGHLNSYTDKEGIKRKSYSIFVQDFDFCGSKNEGAKTQTEPKEAPDTMEKAEGDIPF